MIILAWRWLSGLLQQLGLLGRDHAVQLAELRYFEVVHELLVPFPSRHPFAGAESP
jgi:hypothetical protein